ncbi:MAG: hypothetical protein JWO98_1054 [Frankiales bacterium]|nr:hypothetical protein [Frankiales bacterium]
MTETCEGPAPARTGPAENATPRKLLSPECRADGNNSAPVDQAGARRLTMRIQLQLDTISSNVEQVILLIEQAKNEKIHEPLGYASWTAYVQEEFGGRLVRLRRAERRPIVEILADTGMSTRAIASVVGVHHDTVATDIQATSARVGNPTREDLGLSAAQLIDAMRMADSTEEEFEKVISEARAEGDLSGEKVVEKLASRKVTGTDGKTYSVPQQTLAKPRRRSLTDAYWTAVYDLEQVLGRLGRLHADDRFVGLREQLQLRHQGTVERLAEALLKLEDDLGGGA